MTRFFYRDPLAAAWMAKHFGMRIDCKNPSYGSYVWQFPTVYSNDPNFILNNFHAGEVAPNSLHLLQPQVGDIAAQLQFNKHRPLVVREDNATYVPAESVAVSYAAELAAKNAIQIIQRDGLAFHWPEIDHG